MAQDNASTPDTATKSAPDSTAASPPKTVKSSRKTILVMTAVAVAGIGMVLYAWGLYPFSGPMISTNNSYVRGQVTTLSSQVSGYIVGVNVSDFAHVKKGDRLVTIDDRIYRRERDQAQGNLDIAIANLENLEQTLAQNDADIGAREADLLQAEAELHRAASDFQRSTALSNKGVVTDSVLEQSAATDRAAIAGVMRAKAALKVAQQVRESTIVSRKVLEAHVQTAQADKDLAEIDLSNSVILAPRDGQLGEALVRPGQYVSAGSQLISLVPDQVWVVANFKETQTMDLEVGQPAYVSVDGLGGAVLQGVVEEISPATGSEFSVLRPDNASGNFTKVVQRIPVRIRLVADPENLNRVRPGMSVRTSVDTTG